MDCGCKGVLGRTVNVRVCCKGGLDVRVLGWTVDVRVLGCTVDVRVCCKGVLGWAVWM